MAALEYRKLTKRIVDRLAVDDKDRVFWDRDLPGFGLRVYPSGRKVYVVQSRSDGKSRRVTVGKAGEITAHEARGSASRLLGCIKSGKPLVEAPPAAPPTVADLGERFLREYAALHCKPNTVKNYRQMVRTHILPVLGELLVSDVERSHVLSFQYAMREKPTAANRALDVLLKMFNLAERWNLRAPDTGNPCKSVRRFREKPRKERFLTPAELSCLGGVLDVAVEERLAPEQAVAAIRLLILTGCRHSEILGLAWDDLDFAAGEMRLRDSKTGGRVVPMPPPACQVLRELPRKSDNPRIFPGRRNNAPQMDINCHWVRIRERAGLADVRLHDLRHTYASRALELGEGLPMIGKLLGHRKIETTARYAHLARESVRASTAKVAGSIGADILC